MKSITLFLRHVALILFYCPGTLSNPTQNTITCLQSQSIPYKDTSSANWTVLASTYNLRVQYVPAAIVLPLTPDDVGKAVSCAAQNALKVQARSGGHSYAAYSTGGVNGSLVIDLREFNGVEVDQSVGIARVGGGVRLGNLALGLYLEGRRAIPHGTDCPGIGVGGHISHGGYGHASRLWGLSVDTVVGLDVVLANSTILYIDGETYPDLFYAFRGAADSFGIITNFYLQTYPAPRQILNFEVRIPAALDNVTAATNGFMNLQDKVFDQSVMGNTGNLSFDITTDQYGNLTISGWCISCALQNFSLSTLPALISGFPKPASRNLTLLSWTGSLENLAGTSSLQQSLYDYDEHSTFYVKSIMTKNSDKLTRDQVQAYWQTVIEQGKKVTGEWWSSIYLWGGVGSKINQPEATASSIGERDALWVFQNYAQTSNNLPPLPDNLTTFIDALTNSLAPPDIYSASSDFTAYLNFIDPDLTPEDSIRAYYGNDNYQKLLNIKKAVDPNYTFWNPQAVGMVEGKPKIVNGVQEGLEDKEGTGERLGLIGGWLVLYALLVAVGAGGLL